MLKPMIAQVPLPTSAQAMSSLYVLSEPALTQCPYGDSMESLAANAPARFVNLASISGGTPDAKEEEHRTQFENQFKTLRPKTANTIVLNYSARLVRLEERKDGIEERMAKAADARDIGDFAAAARHYRLAAYDLQTPVDNSPFSKPIYAHLVDVDKNPIGPKLLAEAILESANFSDPTYAAENIHRLNYFIDNPPAGGHAEAVLTKARILKVKNIAEHATKGIHSKVDSLEQAHSQLRSMFYDIDPEKDEAHKELHLFAGTSLVEITARLFFFAHKRGDRKACAGVCDSDIADEKDGEEVTWGNSRKEMPTSHIKALQDYLNDIQRVHAPSNIDSLIDGNPDLKDSLNAKRNRIASYRSAIAHLFASQGYWNSALQMARTLTSHPLHGTAAAQALLKAETFNRFTDNVEFLDPESIPDAKKDGSFGKWLQQVLHNAQSVSLMESTAAGSLGLLTGFLGNMAIGDGTHSIAAGTICASAFYLFNLLLNGRNSEPAKVAGDLGILERKRGEILRDFGAFTLKAIKSGVWVVPAALATFAPDVASNLWNTLCLFGGEYLGQLGDLAGGIASSAESFVALSDPENAKAALESMQASAAGLSDIGWDEVLGTSLGLSAAAAGTFFFLNISSDKFKSVTEETWWPVATIPAAMFCATLLGMAIQHAGCDDQWYDRFYRTIPITFGSVLFMLNSGVMGFVRKKKEGQKESLLTSIWDSFNPRKNDYSLPIIMIVTNGATSALGGNVQHAFFSDPKNIAELMTRGVAMPIGLLAITLGLSGVVKGKVPLKARIREALQDTQGMGFGKRAYEVAMSFGSALFTSAYSANRLFRTMIYDPPGAVVRFALGWDTWKSAAVQKIIDMVMGDGASTTTWNETSNTRWERGPLLQALNKLSLEIKSVREEAEAGNITEQKTKERIYEFMKDMRTKLKITGQSMHSFHLAMDHKRKRDFIWPLHSVSRAFRHPKFTHRVNTHFYQDVYQLLMDSHTDLLDAEELKKRDKGKAIDGGGNGKRDGRLRLTEEEFDALIDLVRVESTKAVSHDRIEPMVQTLLLARDSERFGKRIDDFFTENRWILDTLNIDVAELERRRGSSFMGNIAWKLSKRFPRFSKAMKSVATFMGTHIPSASALFARLKPDIGTGRHPLRRIDHKRFRGALKSSFKGYERRIRSDRRQPDETELFDELFNIDYYDITEPKPVDTSIRNKPDAAPPGSSRPSIPSEDAKKLREVLGGYSPAKFI